MPDKEKLERELTANHPEPWVRHLLASFPDAYFRGFDSSQVSRHLSAMRSVSDERPVVVHAEPESEGVWRLDVVGYDAFQFLSTLCALLVVRELSIAEGRVYTSRPPDLTTPTPRRGPGPRHAQRNRTTEEPDRRPRIVDVFHVQMVRAATRLQTGTSFAPSSSS